MPDALWLNVSAVLVTTFLLHCGTTSTLDVSKSKDGVGPAPPSRSNTGPSSLSDAVSLQVHVLSREDGVQRVGGETPSVFGPGPEGIPVHGSAETGLSRRVKRAVSDGGHRKTLLGPDGRHAEETSAGEDSRLSQRVRKNDICCEVAGREARLGSEIADKISEFQASFNGTFLAESILSTIIIVFLILLSIPILDVFIHPEFYLGAEHTLGHGGPGGYGGFYDGYGVFDYSGVGYGGPGGGVGGYDALYGGYASRRKIKR